MKSYAALVCRHVRPIRSLLQGIAIEDRNPPAAGGDQAFLLERLYGLGDAGAIDAEHQAEKLVREGHFVTVDAIVGWCPRWWCRTTVGAVGGSSPR